MDLRLLVLAASLFVDLSAPEKTIESNYIRIRAVNKALIEAGFPTEGKSSEMGLRNEFEYEVSEKT